MRLRSLLRYNTRHTLYLEKGVGIQLNPIMSRSHNADGSRTRRWTEPLWLFRMRQRIFAFAGRQSCGRRGESRLGATRDRLPDTWDLGPDGNRTCSYCGSIHFDDLMRICRLTLEDERYAIEGTTKSYKVYVRQPGVRNASEGAIKFYMAHAPVEPTPADQKLFADAVRLSSERFAKRWEKPIA